MSTLDNPILEEHEHRFDKIAKRLIKENIIIDWPERAYRAGLRLICRFDDKRQLPQSHRKTGVDLPYSNVKAPLAD